MRVFSTVDARLALPESYTPENAPLEIANCARHLMLITLAYENDENDSLPSTAEPGSPSPEANVDADGKLLHLSANVDGGYKNMMPCWAPFC